MSLKNLYSWNSNSSRKASTVGSACGSKDRPVASACGAKDAPKKAASACGAKG